VTLLVEGELGFDSRGSVLRGAGILFVWGFRFSLRDSGIPCFAALVSHRQYRSTGSRPFDLSGSPDCRRKLRRFQFPFVGMYTLDSSGNPSPRHAHVSHYNIPPAPTPVKRVNTALEGGKGCAGNISPATSQPGRQRRRKRK
jgi:hypothetical protein